VQENRTEGQVYFGTGVRGTKKMNSFPPEVRSSKAAGGTDPHHVQTSPAPIISKRCSRETPITHLKRYRNETGTE
jgi:hypothetical protein